MIVKEEEEAAWRVVWSFECVGKGVKSWNAK